VSLSAARDGSDHFARSAGAKGMGVAPNTRGGMNREQDPPGARGCAVARESAADENSPAPTYDGQAAIDKSPQGADSGG
jgi:hypothetical protein